MTKYLVTTIETRRITELVHEESPAEARAHIPNDSHEPFTPTADAEIEVVARHVEVEARLT